MKVKYLMFCAAAALISCFVFPTFAFAAEPSDAHFFLRYDNTIPNDGNVADCPPNMYFPIGDTSPGYHYGDDSSDYSSVDGQVYSRAAQVEGAEAIITKGNINLYNSFGVDYATLKPFFKVIYDNIAVMPDDAVIAFSIGKAMGAEWENAYISGSVDIVWYVIKDWGHHVNVDGCLYWTKSGDSVSKDDVDWRGTPLDPIDKDNAPIIKPADPMDPGYAVDPEPDIVMPADPMGPDFDVDYEPPTNVGDDIDNSYLVDEEPTQPENETPTVENKNPQSIASENEVDTPIGDIKIIQEDASQMPQTNDDVLLIINIVITIAILSVAIIILACKNKQNQ